MNNSQEEQDSEYLYKTSCSSCGSSDACAVYSDEHTYCFACGVHTRGTNTKSEQRRTMNTELIQGEVRALGKRKISVETCARYGYMTGEYKGKIVQIAQYRKDGSIVAQHLRYPDKQFGWLGEAKDVELYGQHLCPTEGKRIVITEGEIDCLTISQLFNNKWPVVSIPSGNKSAKKSLKRHLEFLEGYEDIVLAFDDDEPGREAVEECAVLFSPGKVRVASWNGFKDANEMLMQGKGAEIAPCIFNAKPYRPDGIVNGVDLWESIQKPIEWGLSYPWDELTKATYGQRMNELIAIGAGTGMGKTDLVKEMVTHNLITHKQNVGLVFLEEANKDTAIGIMNKHASKLFHIPGMLYTDEEKLEAYEATMGSGRVFMYNHFGHTDYETIKSRIRFMAVSCNCTFIYLDHITALVSGDKDGDERKQLDYIMTDLASLVRELNINIHFISHLSTPEGKPHEEGGRVQIKHFRGSRAIGQWSSYMLGLERNQQASTEEERHTSTLRVLKDRYTGRATGFTLRLKYEQGTGRLNIAPPEDEQTNQKEHTQGDF